jgi:GWxTD domain-containing protein
MRIARTLSLLPLVLFFASGCGGRGGQPAPIRSGTISKPLEVYHQAGMLVGSPQFPIVASFATLAGPADSTFVLMGMSIPNAALRFQRDANGFFARYNVALTFSVDSVVARRAERRETVRVPGFAETSRLDESVVFQTLVPLAPGRYVVKLEVRDVLGVNAFDGTDTLDVPAYHARGARMSAPVFVYRSEPRDQRASVPALIVNPRHTVPYGSDSARIYVELYDTEEKRPATLRLSDDRGAELWRSEVAFGAPGSVRAASVPIPPDMLPLGRLWLELQTPGDTSRFRAPLLVTISDQWMVANFEEVLEFVAYIAAPEELDSLRSSSGAERRGVWERFWKRRDPLPATAVNEFREEFFDRIRVANLQFSEEGIAGWRTDRGEVYVVLGPADQTIERIVGRGDATGRANALQWIYDTVQGGELSLLFIDRTGFGRFELTPDSRSEFRRIAARLRTPGAR